MRIVEKGKALNFQNSFCPHSPYSHEFGELTQIVDHEYKRPKRGFHEKMKELHCSTKCVALRFENLSPSSRYFSELKDLSLDGLAM